jgi:8-amino-7-oxononanoate synthase
MTDIDQYLAQILQNREKEGLLRQLRTPENLIDFCSNDYLGFARKDFGITPIISQNGSTGSRLLAGNTVFVEELEQEIADFHGAEAGLIFNSGYDANLGLLSCLPQANDYLITDQYIHASMIDGARLSKANRLIFKHNDLEDLETQLQKARKNSPQLIAHNSQLFVAIESIYSMDGDMVPLPQIVHLCQQYNAHLIVDEAHATGIFGEQGRGICSMYHLENQLFARIITFGKALGCHGAIVLGSRHLRDYLINFARSFIYTTAAPMHTYSSVKAAYHYLKSPDFSNQKLHQLIRFFRKRVEEYPQLTFVDSYSAIQCIIISGNENCRKTAVKLQQAGLDIRAILSPTVPVGQERLRICLHDFNTEEEINRIFQNI